MSFSDYQYISDEAMFMLFLYNILVCSIETCSSITLVSIDSVFYWISLVVLDWLIGYLINPMCSDQIGGSDFQYISNCSSINLFQPILNCMSILLISVSYFLVNWVLSIYLNIIDFLFFWLNSIINPISLIYQHFLDSWSSEYCCCLNWVFWDYWVTLDYWFPRSDSSIDLDGWD